MKKKLQKRLDKILDMDYTLKSEVGNVESVEGS